MSIFILSNILKSYMDKDPRTLKLLEEHTLYFIPIINVDGFKAIEKYYNEHDHTFVYIRKNQQKSSECRWWETGVDLNRNFGFKWGINNAGSSKIRCSEDYRGAKAFSEPETMAMKRFIETHKNIKMALNFHAYGNLFITPFNYDSRYGNPHLLSEEKFKGAAEIYEEIIQHAEFPYGNLQGNGISTIGYSANGEMSDWMLQAHGIIAASPELGIIDEASDKFFLDDPTVLQEVIVQNYHWVRFMLNKLGAEI